MAATTSSGKTAAATAFDTAKVGIYPDDPGFSGIIGTPNPDYLAGTSGNDWIFGDAGNDTIVGFAGNDAIDAGRGNDAVWAGAGDLGNDVFDGGPGHDTLGGGAGNDTLIGGMGSDLIFGGAGSDLILAGVNGGTSSADVNIVWAGAAQTGSPAMRAATSRWGFGQRQIVGNAGNDTIFGGADSSTDLQTTTVFTAAMATT